MKVEPSCSLPALCMKNGGALCIVNLQKTGYDEDCRLSGGVRIFAKIDDFFKMVMEELQIQVKEYTPLMLPEQNLIRDEEADTGIMSKYNVHSMADDGSFNKKVSTFISNSMNIS